MAKKKPVELPKWEEVAEPVPPDAAIEYWKQKAKLPYDEAKALGEEAMHRAFYVTGLAQHDLVQLVSDGLQQALENGETLKDFKARIAKAIEAQGWHGYRVENIFRTNMQTAYMAGRYRKMQDVKKSRPYWQYIAVMDRRVRPSHAMLHELVYPADHEFWAANYPPNGFRCRCTVRTLSERQVKAQGLEVQKKMPEAGMWADPKTGMEYFVHFPGADAGFRNNPGKDWVEAGLNLAKAGLEGAKPPKKEPVTQKKLAADIEAIEALIQQTQDAEALAGLQEKKAELQALLEKKHAAAEKKKLNAQKKKVEAQLAGLPPVKTYSGIWMDDVTTEDWSAKAGAIPSKKAYFQEKLKGGELTPEETAKFEGYLKDLDEFDAEGKVRHELQTKYEKILKSLSELGKKGRKKSSPFSPDAYSQARKDAALWAQSPEDADAVLREKCGEVWRGASKAEKQALYDYTVGSGGFNRPLRGYEGSWSSFKGVGKVDLNYEGRGEAIRHMTEAIERSSYDRDVWLQRGVDAKGLASFLHISESDLYLPLEKLREKLAKAEPVDDAFMSCGSSKGKGFGGYIIHIYCPAGTKMIYAEPFSHYGAGDKISWDGKSNQKYYGQEDETIIQRGTKFRVSKIEKEDEGLVFYIEVIEQI